MGLTDMMIAAVWTAEGTLEVKDVPKPKIRGSNEVLARVRAAGICGSDLHGWRVTNPERVGRITGHELAGEVVEVGDAVPNVKVGDRVAIESLVECGECRWCKMGRYHLCPDLSRIRSETLSRGFSQYVRGSSEKFTRIEDHVKTEWAPLLDCYAVNVHAFQLADLKMHETVAVIGQGPMGLTMTDLANAVGVKTVALALRDFPLSVAEEVGAWATVNSSRENPVKRVLELTDNYGVDTTFLQAGGRNPNPLLQALRMTKKGGKVMIVGMPTGGNVVEGFNTRLLRGEKMLRSVNSFSYWDEYSENAIALDYVTRGKLHPECMITHRFPLQGINEAFETAANKKVTNAIKVMIIQDEA
jgi:L-iditol 2-dehydrogenase